MKTEVIKFNDFWLPLALVALTFAKEKKSKGDYEAFCQRQPRSRKGSLTDRLKICAHLIEINHIILVGEVMTLNPNPSFQWLDSQLVNGDEAAWRFIKELGFKDKIGRIRDIQIQPSSGKLFFLSSSGSLWKLEK